MIYAIFHNKTQINLGPYWRLTSISPLVKYRQKTMYCDLCYIVGCFVCCSHKEGYDTYTSWKRLWTQYGSTDHGVKSFMMDQMLPYWVQCNLCEKWRSVFRDTDVSPKYLKNYVCTRVLKVFTANVYFFKPRRVTLIDLCPRKLLVNIALTFWNRTKVWKSLSFYNSLN